MQSSHLKLFMYFWAFLLSSTLVFLPFEGLTDRVSYINTLNNIIKYKQNYIKEDSLFIFFVSDPIWYYMNFALAKLIPTDWTIRLIIFFGSFTTLCLLINQSKREWLPLIFLVSLSPAFLTHYIGHLRQGFALTLMVISYFMWRKKPLFSVFILIFAIFTHNITAICIFLVFLKNLLQKCLGANLSIVIFALINIIIFNNQIIAQVLNILQHRQYEYYNSITYDPSGRILVLIVILLASFSVKRSFIKTEGAYFFVFYLLTYFTLPISARVFESMFVLLTCQVVQSDMRQKYLPVLSTGLYVIASLMVFSIYS
jgi:hypothetical protein